MKAQQIRETFLNFFAKKNHKIINSSPLLPKDDPTLLFTNAGMNQFKDIFLGLEKRSYNRAVSVQKCMRVSGKHNDLEQVGITNKHHTFFEMLGNFSFGDYFKQEAVIYAWELITEVFKINKNKLYITVYEKDDEAFQLWNEEIGLPEEKIFRFGQSDNFWSMGETGPCGPCSEIHYDLDFKTEENDPYILIEKGSDRFLELWNLVFMQYYRDEKEKLHLLPSPSIDTGMGLERLVTSLQAKQNNFDTDLFLPIIEAISDLSEREYQSHEEGIFFRIIADHLRAVTFLIGDGIIPSNEGRGYVLRRLIRRAYRKGNILGIQEPFLYKLVGVVIDIMKDAYPELLSSSNYISKICLSEETRFSYTLSSGLRTFDQYIKEIDKLNQHVLPGSKLFKLYDTFGFPLDLSLELAEEKNKTGDEKGFYNELEKQRQRARLAWKNGTKHKDKSAYAKLKNIQTDYVGYDMEKTSGTKVIAIMNKGKLVQELKEGDSGEVFLKETPFYPEAGGQIGDSGILKNPHFSGVVEKAFYPLSDIIANTTKAISGRLCVGDTVETAVDIPRRKAISRNHTSTHLLHASLRQILGDHVKQAGSLVSDSRIRFDFTHFSSLTSSEFRQIEALVNEKIRANLKVAVKITTLEQGISEGAMAIFEEKYGDKVRMILIGEFSKELCGGVHVEFTGEIGLFKITTESSVGAGMRRIEAVSGEEALNYVQANEGIIEDIQQSLNSSRNEILNQIDNLKESLKEKEKANKSLRQKMAHSKSQKGIDEVKKIKGISVIIQKVEGITNAELGELADSLKQKIVSGVVVLGATSEKKAVLVISVTKDLTKRIKANELINKIAPMIGGGGGGRPDFAQAGGNKPGELSQVLEKSPSILEKMIR
ncbi:alanine--tRNA ligase [Acidobacteriota bacterium]